MEKLLRDVEYFATLVSLDDPQYTYPKKELDEIWKDVLLNQFHDVLPGTSIRMAMEDAEEIYERREKQARILLDDALDRLAGEKGDEIAAFDGARLPRKEIIDTPAGLKVFVSDGDGICLVEEGKQDLEAKVETAGNDHTLSNSLISLTISSGRITSIYDKTIDRELIIGGTAGLIIYDDLPLSYDAWDAEIYHLEMGTELSFDTVEAIHHRLRPILRCTSSFGKSKAILDISLDLTKQIRMNAHVHWHQTHKFLKCESSLSQPSLP
jgi:alpha-mannosidase